MTYLTDGSITVSLDTTYDTRRNAELIISRVRNIGGKSFDKLWGSFDQFEFPMNYVSNSDAGQLNEWWEGTTELTLFFDATSYSCYIVSDDQPFQALQRPYLNEWTGVVVIGVL